MVTLPRSLSPLHVRGRGKAEEAKGRRREINSIQRWAELGAMKIAESAACRKAAKCVRQSEGEMGCAP